MQSDHILLAVDRRHRPINFTQLLWSSAASPWRGFRLERHSIGPTGCIEDFSLPHVLLGLCLCGSANLKVGSDLHARQVVVRPGRFTMLADGSEQLPMRWTGTRETLYVSMGPEQIDRLMGPALRMAVAPGSMSLAPQFAVDDAQVSRLMLNMYEEAQAGCPAGELYGDALCVALAGYLLSRYGRRERRLPRFGRTLSRSTAARVTEYMQAHLARNISLVEVADLAGLSAHHFSLVFKNTFDATPHQYLLLKRVERAKQLLALHAESIGEVALDVGFADQSHFTRMFRRLTGETPRQYQRLRA